MNLEAYYAQISRQYKMIRDLMEGYPVCEFCDKTVLTHEESAAIGEKVGRYPMDYCNGSQYMQTDPFAQEIHGDHTEYLLCDGQAYESGMDI